MSEPALVVGARQIAEMLKVKPRTPAKWMTRPATRFPAPDHPNVNDGPAWFRATIIEWAGETRRLPADLLGEGTPDGDHP